MEEVKSTIVLEAVNSALGDSWAEFTFASNICAFFTKPPAGVIDFLVHE